MTLDREAARYRSRQTATSINGMNVVRADLREALDVLGAAEERAERAEATLAELWRLLREAEQVAHQACTRISEERCDS